MQQFLLLALVTSVVALSIAQVNTERQRRALCYTIHGRPRPCQGKRSSIDTRTQEFRQSLDALLTDELMNRLNDLMFPTPELQKQNPDYARISKKKSRLPWDHRLRELEDGNFGLQH
ncbi:uncharacterized protein [Apostichopus japonicus]|uniref:uncharacterized protein isoform X2 n=1 Tax=Stichopus japonicus TaxID=307972 RepID=UPI003AB41EFE